MTNDVNLQPISNYTNNAWGMSTNRTHNFTHIPFYQVELSVTEFFIQSALASLYRNGQLVSEPVVLDESAMGSFRSALSFQYTLKGEFTNAGFDIATMFCRVQPFAANNTGSTEPVVTISRDRYFALNTTVMVDMQCSTN